MTISGPGAGYRPRHYSDLMALRSDDAPQWLEILSENFMSAGGVPLRNLLQLREKFPLCMHGVSMSIAGQDPFEKSYLRDLKKLIELVDPVYVSDHLCWTSNQGHNSHDLLPVSYASDTLRHVCERIQFMQDTLNRTLLFENPSAYVAFSADQMSEGEFLAEMCRRTGCGLLLDVNNLFVNHKNLGTDVFAWLDRVNPEWIGYVHMAGHSVGEFIRIDTHDERVCPEVWNLYSYVSTKFGPLPAMIEWDGDVPEFSVLQEEVLKLKEYMASETGIADLTGFDASPSRQEKSGAEIDWKQVQAAFFSIVTSEVTEHSNTYLPTLFRAGTPAPAATGAEVYANAYLQRLTEVLRGAYPVLHSVIGPREFNRLVQKYLKSHHPSHYSVKFAGASVKDFAGLAVAADQCGIDRQLLIDLVTLEWTVYDLSDAVGLPGKLDRSVLTKINPERWAGVRFRFQPTVVCLPVQYRVDQTIEAFRKNQTPPPPPAEPVSLLVYRDEDEVTWAPVSDLEIALYKGIQENLAFEKCCTLYQSRLGESIEETVFKAVAIIGDWLDQGIIDQLGV